MFSHQTRAPISRCWWELQRSSVNDLFLGCCGASLLGDLSPPHPGTCSLLAGHVEGLGPEPPPDYQQVKVVALRLIGKSISPQLSINAPPY